MTIKRRLAVLERARGGLSRFIVVIGPAGFGYDDELRSRGITRTARDSVVVVAKPNRGAGRTVTVDGLG